MGSNTKRDLAKEQFWRKTIASCSTSGLSRSQFCKKKGLNVELLRYWAGVIAERDEEQQLIESRKVPTDQTFLPVVVVESKTHDRLPGTQQMPVAEIVVAGGSIRLFNGITTDTCRALWLALREGTQ